MEETGLMLYTSNMESSRLYLNWLKLSCVIDVRIDSCDSIVTC